MAVVLMPSVSGKLYVFGGIDVRNQHKNDLHRFDFNTETWESVPCENAPCARGNTAAAVVNGKVRVI